MRVHAGVVVGVKAAWEGRDAASGSDGPETQGGSPASQPARMRSRQHHPCTAHADMRVEGRPARSRNICTSAGVHAMALSFTDPWLMHPAWPTHHLRKPPSSVPTMCCPPPQPFSCAAPWFPGAGGRRNRRCGPAADGQAARCGCAVTAGTTSGQGQEQGQVRAGQGICKGRSCCGCRSCLANAAFAVAAATTAAGTASKIAAETAARTAPKTAAKTAAETAAETAAAPLLLLLLLIIMLLLQQRGYRVRAITRGNKGSMFSDVSGDKLEVRGEGEQGRKGEQGRGSGLHCMVEGF